MTAILLSTAVWHALATWHFGVTPGRTLALTTAQRPVGEIPTELFRFLAGMNTSAVVLALGAAASDVPDVRWLAALALAVANGSQLAQDVRVARLGIARGPMFRTIIVGDALFTALNLGIVVAGGG